MKGISVARCVFAIVAFAGVVVAFALSPPLYTVNSGSRAALEAMIELSAIIGAGFFVATFRHSRRLVDLLLLCALVGVAVSDFVYCAVPVMAGGVGLESGGGGRLATGLITAIAFAAAAFAPRKRIADPRGGVVAVAAVVGAGAVILAELAEQGIGSHWGVSSLKQVGMIGAAQHPFVLAVEMFSAAVLIASAVAFLARGRRGERGSALLAAAVILLAAGRMQHLAMPAVATDWLTPREGFRAAAYFLLLTAALRQYAADRRSRTDAAIASERERIARDLHDGLAQDLACIAAQGQRLGLQLGTEHPLMVAARHALAASRGAIVDLTASAAPSTEAALRLIADELSHRYGVEVGVRVESETRGSSDIYLEQSKRDHLLRIAREAVANAALHGTARHVDVLVVQRGKALLMRVCDDGCGITDGDRTGFGLRMMHDRAASLGGHLSARPGVDGGTELELLVS